jgi:hypothetical protein
MAVTTNAQLVALAWSLGWRIAAGIIIGYYADDWLGTTPLLTLVLALAALVSCVRQMIAMLQPEHLSDGTKRE